MLGVFGDSLRLSTARNIMTRSQPEDQTVDLQSIRRSRCYSGLWRVLYFIHGIGGFRGNRVCTWL